MIGSPHLGERPVAATESSPIRDWAGPLPLPAGLVRSLHTLAHEAGADELAPMLICAGVLAGRLTGKPCRVRLRHGSYEAEISSTATDPASSLRAALRSAAEAADHRAEAADHRAEPTDHWAEPADPDVFLWLSPGGRQLFGASRTGAADAPTVHCWMRTFRQLLCRLAAEPDAPMQTAPLVSAAERDRILYQLNRYRDPVLLHRSMTEPFEEQAERSPDAPALLDEYGHTLSYRELNERANRLAHFLLATGAGPGTRVGICLSRSIGQIVAIYAAVKAGAEYVPLDPELPDARLGYMLADCAPSHVLTDPQCRDRIPTGPWLVQDIEAGQAWQACPATNPEVDTTAAAPLNILYTSGSTGRPKGVEYPTDGALAHLAWMQSRYPFGPGDTALFKTSPGFDVSIWELFWPLWHGARLLICRPGGHRDPRHLAELVAAYRINTLFLPPTVMTPFLANVAPGRAGSLRWLLCGGEPITPRIRDGCHDRLPAATLVNCYGPTEAGTVTDMPLAAEPGAAVPLGRPAEHFRLTVLDEELAPVPVGLPGEAYLGGRVGLAYGYWRAPGRTAERFVADPYGPPGSRMYRTGDLCRYRDDGTLEHLGRIDRQVKLRGMRIEPGEIETVFAAHPAVADCAVLVHGKPARLLAFVVPAAGVRLDLQALQHQVAATLPDYMRPEAVVPVPGIPATVNGKIDRDALLAGYTGQADRELVPPADELEAQLAEIYGQVLGTAPVSMLDTFAGLGGHSLLAFQLLDDCQRRLQAKPDVLVLFTGTVRDVATSLRAVTSAHPATAGHPATAAYPATSGQVATAGSRLHTTEFQS